MARAFAAVLVSLAVSGVASAAPTAQGSTPMQLLARHAPVLVLHPDERLAPVPVDGFLADSDLQVRSPDGTWQSHEGDWEAVTLLLDARERPLLVGLSEHCTGARRDWKGVQRRGSRPVVYVALGSHANYFTPGKKPLVRSCWPQDALALADAYSVPLLDSAARGRTVAPIVTRVTAAAPSWMAFAGTWGEDQFVHLPGIAPVRFRTGPKGPAHHQLWRTPVATVLTWPVAH